MAFDGVLEYVSCIAMVMFHWFHLCRIIEKTISPSYNKIFQTYYKIPRSTDAHMMDASPVSLPKEFFQIFAACGPYLHRDTIISEGTVKSFTANLSRISTCSLS